jgi:L-malate glycosyltransferase
VQKAKKIAIIVPRIVQKGPLIVVRSIINSLCSSDEYDISLFYMFDKIDLDLGIKSKMYKLSWFSFPLHDFDIIHTHGFIPDLYAFVKRKKIRNHFVTIHNYVFQDIKFKYGVVLSFIIGYLWLYSWRKADKLICVSDSLRQYYLRWFDTSKLQTIYNGLGEYYVSDEPSNDIINTIEYFRSKGLKIIGSIGVLEKRKGIELLIQVLSLRSDLALVIIGEGSRKKKLEKFARRTNIEDRCLFCGFKRSPQQFYKYFDYYISPSLSEGFGLALVEAVSEKIPVVCSDIEVFKELFKDDEVSFYKNRELTSLFEKLKSDYSCLKLKSESAFKRFQNYYTVSLMAVQYGVLYQSV